MSMEQQRKSVAPSTRRVTVELEQGFMSASIMDPNDNRDDGVSIEGHEIRNTGDYTDIGWDNEVNANSFK